MKFKANTKEYDRYKKAYDTGALFEIEGFTLISKEVQCRLEIESWQAVHELQKQPNVITLSDVDIRLDVRENLLAELKKIRTFFNIFSQDDTTPAMLETLSRDYIRGMETLRMVEGHYMARDGHTNYIPF